jgi:phosphate starvation-inducible protein PhoH
MHHSEFDQLPDFITKRNLNRKDRKRLRRQGIVLQEDITTKTGGLRLRPIQPKTINQQRIMEDWDSGLNINCIGSAGTGKSFISLYLALRELFEDNSPYEKIIIVRSAVSGRNIGFLPGSLQEKIEVFEGPYISICNDLFGRGDAYETLKKKNLVEFISTSFLRGLTLDNCIIVLDEVQNGTFQELSSVITRLGDNARLFILGDGKQADLRFDDERRGFYDFQRIVTQMPEFATIEMGVQDIVRGGLVKSFLLLQEKFGLT